MEGRFVERETGAEYYVRELPDGTIAWVGEHVPVGGARKAFANVFLGRRIDHTHVQGDLIDVPKGAASGEFRDVRVELTESGFRFDLPGVGQRTLGPPETDFTSNDAFECGVGFYDEPVDEQPFSLTGAWQCSDGGSYYVRQVGSTVVWFGEHPSMAWANIFVGESTDAGISGRWIDVPKGATRGSGTIDLAIESIPLLSPMGPVGAQTVLTRRSVTGGFGGATWNKTDVVRVACRLETLKIVSNADVGGLNPPGDEPYLIPVSITLGGNQYVDPAALINFADPSRPLVESALFRHPWGTGGDWPKNNLTWREDLVPGTVVLIPDYIGYRETELRTLRGLQPNSAIGRDTATYVPGVMAMEEASSRNDDVRAGIAELLSSAPNEIHRAIVPAVRAALGGSSIDVPGIVNAVRTALTNRVNEVAIASAKSDLFGILGAADRDKGMGAAFTPYSLGWLRDQSALVGASVPIEMRFAGGAGGSWVATGTVSATLGPPRFAGEIVEFEVTLETGDDDKREDSVVEFTVRAADGDQGPFSVHAPGERFPDRTLHTVRLKLDRPVLLGNQRTLVIQWRRGPGGGVRSPDSWKLERIRVVAFDRLNRRQVLLNHQAVNRKLEGRRVLTIALPRA